ncbi:ABC transporter substrate-binding protein [Parafrankia elaeagni]|uniref:ABC transporter substrate-binding protein n=1 Tax=Parafrankia elaeagni TaxID=222534 RepID=UPI001E34D8DA|nr:ABC transporter substrate-binding protein [Parafrankia elaeagni]
MLLSRRKRSLGLAVAAVLAAAGVTSCSGGAGSSGSSATCESPGITPDMVNLGLVVTDSGVGSTAFASARSGIDARIGQANEEGGVHGRQIAYEWHDDANSPAQSDRVVEEFLRDNSVFGLMAVTLALGESIDTMSALRVPVVGYGLPTWASHTNMFSNLSSAAPTTLGRYIQANGGTKVGVVMTGASASTIPVIDRYNEAFRSIGLTTTETIQFSSATDNPARVVQQLASDDVNALVAFTVPEDLARIMQAARQSDLSLTSAVSFTGYDRSVLSALGPQLSGVSFPVYFLPFEAGGPAIDRYRDGMTRFAPETVQTDQRYALNSYIYADMFLRGLDLAGECPTREGFIDALRKVSDYDAGGLIEPVNLANNATEPLNCHAFVKINPAGTAFDVVRKRLCADGTGS